MGPFGLPIPASPAFLHPVFHFLIVPLHPETGVHSFLRYALVIGKPEAMNDSTATAATAFPVPVMERDETDEMLQNLAKHDDPACNLHAFYLG